MSSASRDFGLRRISRMTRWVAAGGMAVAGVFAIAVAKVQPGRASASTGSSGSAGAVSTSPPSGTAGSAGAQSSGEQASGGPQAPVQLPQATRGHSSIVSGGS